MRAAGLALIAVPLLLVASASPSPVPGPQVDPGGDARLVAPIGISQGPSCSRTDILGASYAPAPPPMMHVEVRLADASTPCPGNDAAMSLYFVSGRFSSKAYDEVDVAAYLAFGDSPLGSRDASVFIRYHNTTTGAEIWGWPDLNLSEIRSASVIRFDLLGAPETQPIEPIAWVSAMATCVPAGVIAVSCGHWGEYGLSYVDRMPDAALPVLPPFPEFLPVCDSIDCRWPQTG